MSLPARTHAVVRELGLLVRVPLATKAGQPLGVVELRRDVALNPDQLHALKRGAELRHDLHLVRAGRVYPLTLRIPASAAAAAGTVRLDHPGVVVEA